MDNSRRVLSSPQSLSSAYHKCVRYLRKIILFNQMDFEFASWQMLYLFIAPQKLIKTFRARHYSKNQYARDDPAFLVLFTAALCITSIGFALVLGLSIIQFFKFLFFVIFVDCIAVGLLVSTFFWYVTNRSLKSKSNFQDVEWAYCFDIHLNALFPPLILLHFVQLFFYNGLINHEWFVSVLLGNTFWLCSCIYYFNTTFLGYDALQILDNSRYFLFPIPCISIIYCITLIVKCNMSQIILDFYKYRVL